MRYGQCNQCRQDHKLKCNMHKDGDFTCLVISRQLLFTNFILFQGIIIISFFVNTTMKIFAIKLGLYEYYKIQSNLWRLLKLMVSLYL